jgi:hypothetical protein
MDFLFSIIMLRRISSKKGKFEGVELGEKVQPLHSVQKTPSSPPKNVMNYPRSHIDKEAHRIATFMQKRKESVDQTNIAPVKKYKPMAKIDVHESSPVSIHVIKKDRISSHRSKPPVIDYRRADKRVTEEPRQQNVKKIDEPRKSTNDIRHSASKPSTVSTNSDKSVKRISLQKNMPNPVQKPIDMTPKNKSQNRQPSRSVSPVNPTSEKKITSLSKKPPANVQKEEMPTAKKSSDMFGTFTKQLKTPTSSVKASHTRPKSKTNLNNQSIQKLFKKTSPVAPERRTSRKKSNDVEWTVVSAKSHYKPVIVSFILSNWEKYNGSIITDYRLKKTEPYMHHFSNLPFNDRYLLASLCTGLKIRKKYGRKGI